MIATASGYGRWVPRANNTSGLRIAGIWAAESPPSYSPAYGLALKDE